MNQELLYLGLDVHAHSISVALAEASGAVRSHGTISGDLRTLERTLARIKRAHPGRKLKVCYEAGPCGFVIARRLGQLHTECLVAAPSLIPSRSGDRVKTDKRDARRRAHRGACARGHR
jgi:transposase